MVTLKGQSIESKVRKIFISQGFTQGVQELKKNNSLVMCCVFSSDSIKSIFCHSGAGHGLSSILQMLLSFPEHFRNRKGVEEILCQAVHYVLRCELPNGNYPPVPGEVCDQDNELVHWCHGAPGVVFLLAKAYLTWKDDQYLHAAKRCADLTWQRGLLCKGPGICHGVAGKSHLC